MGGRRPTLSADLVREVRAWHAARIQSGKRVGLCAKKMAVRIGMSRDALYKIANRNFYRWVQ